MDDLADWMLLPCCAPLIAVEADEASEAMEQSESFLDPMREVEEEAREEEATELAEGDSGRCCWGADSTAELVAEAASGLQTSTMTCSDASGRMVGCVVMAAILCITSSICPSSAHSANSSSTTGLRQAASAQYLARSSASALRHPRRPDSRSPPSCTDSSRLLPSSRRLSEGSPPEDDLDDAAAEEATPLGPGDSLRHFFLRRVTWSDFFLIWSLKRFTSAIVGTL